MEKLKTVKGTHDLLEKDFRIIDEIIGISEEVSRSFNFEKISTPIIEFSDLFSKTLGQGSDIVQKEMYTFIDQGEKKICLRPEATSGIARYSVENYVSGVMKLFTFGPMFRRERPQKGRYRQFNQINFEILGSSEPISDAEIIILADQFLKSLKIKSEIKLFLNSLGDLDTLKLYKEKLATYYQNYKNSLSKESQLKIEKNPIRILDSKNPEDIKINPDSSQKNIFQGVIKELEFLGSNFRGLIEVDFKSQKTNLRCQFSSEYILKNSIEKNNSINISLRPEALKVIKK